MEAHEGANELFMKEWDKWVSPLVGYSVATTFVWITPNAHGTRRVSREAKYEIKEKGKKGERIYPSYEEAFVALGEVQNWMWRLYKKYAIESTGY